MIRLLAALMVLPLFAACGTFAGAPAPFPLTHAELATMSCAQLRRAEQQVRARAHRGAAPAERQAIREQIFAIHSRQLRDCFSDDY